MKYRSVYSRVVDKTTGVRLIKALYSTGLYETGLSSALIRASRSMILRRARTNNFVLSAAVIAALHQKRWSVELFFKWAKHNSGLPSAFMRSQRA